MKDKTWELAKQMLAGTNLIQKDLKWKKLRKMPLGKLAELHQNAIQQGYVVEPPHLGWTFYAEDIEKIVEEKLR